MHMVIASFTESLKILSKPKLNVAKINTVSMPGSRDAKEAVTLGGTESGILINRCLDFIRCKYNSLLVIPAIIAINKPFEFVKLTASTLLTV